MKIRNNRSGLAVIHWLLIAGIVILLILIGIPVYQRYKAQADEYACDLELSTARDMLTIDYLTMNGTPTADDAIEEVTYAMDGWDNLCIRGGDTFVIVNSDSEVPYTVVCGIHDEDTYQRTRLNAENARRKIKEQLKLAKARGEEAPDEITITLNSSEYTCVRVDEEQNFYTGTGLTPGYEKKKCVIYYGLNGKGSFSNDDLSENELAYFCYADENHCANWTPTLSWRGDSFSK